MVKLYDGGVYLVNGTEIVPEAAAPETYQKDTAKQGTIAYSILKAHNTAEDMQNLRLKFDALASHDITFVGIIQTARASGMEKFPIPYVLTNCHNSLCAVGGTINEDDHVFGLSAARKYGGIYVPPHMAVGNLLVKFLFAVLVVFKAVFVFGFAVGELFYAVVVRSEATSAIATSVWTIFPCMISK